VIKLGGDGNSGKAAMDSKGNDEKQFGHVRKLGLLQVSEDGMLVSDSDYTASLDLRKEKSGRKLGTERGAQSRGSGFFPSHSSPYIEL
jgi:hypothetical protein